MKSKKKLMTAAAICCAALAAFVLQNYGWLHPTSQCGEAQATSAIQGEEGTVYRNGDTNVSRMAITCNVDWGEEQIPEILSILGDKDVKVTFFVSGRWAENNPDLVRRMYLLGHEIQSHGYKHKLSTHISLDEEREEMKKTEDAVYQILGEKTTVYAPPSGDYDGETVNLCRELGYKLSLWSADTIDWRQDSTADVILDRILKKPMKGAIILMHPKPESVKALPKIIDEIHKQKIEIVPLCDLLMLQ